MASTYSTNLRLELIGTGDQSGTWGTTTNTNLGTLLEQAISGYTTQAMNASTDVTLSFTDGASSTPRNMYLELTGTMSQANNLIVPANRKLYFIYNNTSGGFAVTVKVSGLTGVSVPNGKKMVLVSNGTDIVEAVTYHAALSLGTALPTGSGGTNLTSFTSGGAVYATSTSALTTGTLPVTAGGTGVTTLTGIVKASGTSAFTAATAGTDYVVPGGALGTPSSGNLGSCTVDGTNSIGYLNLPQNAQSSNYSLVNADRGKHIYSTNAGAQTITVPTNGTTAIDIGAAITIVNNGTTAITFTTTGTTVYKAGTSTAWASGGTLAVRGMCTLMKVASDTWFINGVGLS